MPVPDRHRGGARKDLHAVPSRISRAVANLAVGVVARRPDVAVWRQQCTVLAGGAAPWRAIENKRETQRKTDGEPEAGGSVGHEHVEGLESDRWNRARECLRSLHEGCRSSWSRFRESGGRRLYSVRGPHAKARATVAWKRRRTLDFRRVAQVEVRFCPTWSPMVRSPPANQMGFEPCARITSCG